MGRLRPGRLGRGRMSRLLAGRMSRLRPGRVSRGRVSRGRMSRGRMSRLRPGRMSRRRMRGLRTSRVRRGRARAGGPRRLRRHRGSAGNSRDRRAAGFCSPGTAARLSLARDAVAVQVVPAHEADQVRPVVGVGRVDAGQGGRELVGVRLLAHGLLVVAAAGQEAAVVVDALGQIVVHAEGRRGADRLAVHVLLGGQRHAACRAGALDAEQVVVPGGQLALAPPRLVDSLGDRDRSRDPVAVLRLDGPRGDRADEGLLGPGLGAQPARR